MLVQDGYSTTELAVEVVAGKTPPPEIKHGMWRRLELLRILIDGLASFDGSHTTVNVQGKWWHCQMET